MPREPAPEPAFAELPCIKPDCFPKALCESWRLMKCTGILVQCVGTCLESLTGAKWLLLRYRPPHAPSKLPERTPHLKGPGCCVELMGHAALFFLCGQDFLKNSFLRLCLLGLMRPGSVLADTEVLLSPMPVLTGELPTRGL